MYGIVGVYHFKGMKKIDEKLLMEMRDTMLHRGPDDVGNYISSDRKLGLGHRRLSIINLANALFEKKKVLERAGLGRGSVYVDL